MNEMEEIEMAKFKVGDCIHAKANIGGHMIGEIIKISNDSRPIVTGKQIGRAHV